MAIVPGGDDLVRCQKDLKTGKWSVEHDLTDQELQAIGYATVQWAYLEHALLMRTLVTAKRAKALLPPDAEHLSFTKRLRAWRILVEETVKTEPERSTSLKLVSKIANVEQDRHKLSHGLWDWDRNRPEHLSIQSFRRPHDFHSRTHLAKLAKLGQTIAQINFDLTFPDGPPVPEFGTSPDRFQRLGLATIVPASPGLPQANPPKRKRPRRPSKR